jgi:hypothetical protein
MITEDYSPEELAAAYQISIQQARRYVARFGSNRLELDALLASSPRTNKHRALEIDRTSAEVALG